jgi:hypothetical protein
MSNILYTYVTVSTFTYQSQEASIQVPSIILHFPLFAVCSTFLFVGTTATSRQDAVATPIEQPRWHAIATFNRPTMSPTAAVTPMLDQCPTTPRIATSRITIKQKSDCCSAIEPRPPPKHNYRASARLPSCRPKSCTQVTHCSFPLERLHLPRHCGCHFWRPGRGLFRL